MVQLDKRFTGNQSSEVSALRTGRENAFRDTSYIC